MAATKAKIERNLERVRANIAVACAKANRDPREVTLLPVTKSADIEGIKAIVELGLCELAESRVPQINERAAELEAWLSRRKEPCGEIRWHMIGHLQRNKVKPACAVASVVHSVDSLRLAEDINERVEKDARVMDVMVQVNCSKEPQKYGCAVGAASHLAELVCTLKNLRLVGLMTMAPLVDDPEQARPAFALLREMFDELRHHHVGGDGFRHLSMGMSHDYMVAIEEGATIVRIGTALFE
jgi:PLP dependent protein